MDNRIPRKTDAVFALAEDMADGLAAHQTSLGVKQNTETVLRGALATGYSAEADYGAALASKKVLTTAARVADSNAKAMLAATRAVFVQRFGAEWSAAWEPTGFPNQSTAVPRTQGERLSLLEAVRLYFAANPTHENAPLNVTGGRAGSLGTALSDARSAANGGLTLAGQKRAVRDAALEALRKRMRGLVDELSQLLGPDDARWHAFGLNLPGSSHIPEIPEGLVLTANGAGNLLVDWGDAARADRYRVWQQIVGTDEEFVAAATVNDSDATLEGLPTGATVRIQVTAANDAGESLPSETKEAVIG